MSTASRHRNVQDVYPLSPMQEGILFHSLQAAEPDVYVTQLSCKLRRLEPAAFRRAWERVVERHPILRSAFAWKGAGKPVQVVGRRTALPWREEDWRGRSGEGLERSLES
jgi:hypothetical protein